MCTVYGDVVTVHTTRDSLDVMIRSARQVHYPRHDCGCMSVLVGA